MQLVINTFGAFLRREGERFLVKAGDKQVTFSAHKVSSILITTVASLSTDALLLAAEKNVDVVFLDKFGDPYGRVAAGPPAHRVDAQPGPSGRRS